MKQSVWYKDLVFYQIWPRSFCDGNGDGMGDLQGVLEKLDYIKSLGVDGIWFSPLYPSPGADCGYDIADYYDIAGEFGGMEAFKAVLNGAHARDMKVIMDLVVNHTSDEHEWFQKSRLRIPPYTDYYIWRPAGENGKLPNNWDSNFEGKAWTWDETRGEYYLHLFAVKQPDLNMDNPLVREEVKQILRFWLDLGVDGFREDVITFISKQEGLPDERIAPFNRGIFRYNHGPHLHEYLQEFRRDVFDHYDCMTLGEAPLVSPKKALEYIRENDDRELDMMIQFQCATADCLLTDFIPLPFSLRRLKRAFSSWQEQLEGKAWNMLYLENHDHARVISRYGSEQFREESGKVLACAYLFLKGTPFIYQGQEIGMVNYPASSISDYEDVQTLNQHKNDSEEKRLKLYARASRDHARTPMQWSAAKNAGFTTGEPWFHVNPNYKEINVSEQEERENSLLNFYRAAISIRKNNRVFRDGFYREYAKLSGNFYIYTRETEDTAALVICSFSKERRRVPPLPLRVPQSAECVLCNYTAGDYHHFRTAEPYETRVYLWAKGSAKG